MCKPSCSQLCRDTALEYINRRLTSTGLTVIKGIGPDYTHLMIQSVPYRGKLLSTNHFLHFIFYGQVCQFCSPMLHVNKCVLMGDLPQNSHFGNYYQM